MIDLQGPAGPAHLRLLDARGNRRPITTTARPSRSAGSTWSPTPAPISTRRSTAMPTARTWPSSSSSRLPTCPGSSSAGRSESGLGDRRRRVRRARRRGQGGAGPHRLGPALAHRRLFRRPSLPDRRGGASGWSTKGAALVGIDSHNIDDTHVRARPVHTTLLGAGHPDLRAYDRSRRAARQRLPLHRRAAEDRRAWGPSRCALTPSAELSAAAASRG